MGFIDRLKKTLGIGQPFDVNAFIDPKWQNPPEVVYPPHALGDGSSSEEIHETELKAREETHWWRHCAERELPDADYYLKNFSEKQLRELVIANRTGHDISVFADPQQTPEQLRYIYMSAEAGEDVSEYIYNLDFDPVALNEEKSAAFLQEIIDIHNAKKERQTQMISLDDKIRSASARSAEFHSVAKSPIKEFSPER